ncbi:unnamed protein product, partial [Rotaria sordida]
MTITPESILDSFRTIYPDDSFYICKFTPPGGSSSFYGNELLDVQLQDGDWLKIYKLSESSGSTLNDNEVRRKALPFVYDTRRVTDDETRRDRLHD